jgi:hypothetical protein
MFKNEFPQAYKKLKSVDDIECSNYEHALIDFVYFKFNDMPLDSSIYKKTFKEMIDNTPEFYWQLFNTDIKKVKSRLSKYKIDLNEKNQSLEGTEVIINGITYQLIEKS